MFSEPEIVKNQFGFFQVKNIPTKEELEKYYSEKYYQTEKGNYQKTYSEKEILFFNNKIAEKEYILHNLVKLPSKSQYTLLDIGCGEGWTLGYFKKKGWNVTGIDYSIYGCQQFNPECVENLIVGDLDSMTGLVGNHTYDVVWLDNVLEHVEDPLATLKKCSQVLSPGGIVVIEVPNDFSILQEYALNKKLIDRKFWIAFPDHLSYFNKQGLTNLAEVAGFSCKYTISDNPIDFNLLNENTNYIVDRTKGKSCHLARVEMDNLMHSVSVEKAVNYYKALADLGMGRQIISFLCLK